ncbi:MAG: lipoyl(octanoyl) transferase LipB [Dehalococcoidales bacterium]|nr:lipoyl(octanoyl) transferase LipB [Dehalococcoidales bacterium]
MRRNCQVYDLGLIEYQQALTIQEKLLDLRKSGAITDALLLLQHPSVFTIGRSGTEENIIVSGDTLVQEGIPVFRASRGGDITYHGPGQLVGYPILNLRENHLNVHQYVWNLEETVIRTLGDFGIEGGRVVGRRGVWVGDQKACALGVRISREVSMHGFALNVNTKLKYFTYIVPCGIVGASVTSISKLLGREVTVDEVKGHLLSHFEQVFQRTLQHEGRLDEWLALPSPAGSAEMPLIPQR